MRVLCCGGRTYSNREKVYEVLDQINSKTPITEIHQGGAFGADRLAAEWAFERDISCEEHPADWKRYGNTAGIFRNIEMFKASNPHMVIAFPGGAGTNHMISVAKRSDNPVEVLEITDESVIVKENDILTLAESIPSNADS